MEATTGQKQTSVLSYHDPKTQQLIKSETEKMLETFQAFPEQEFTAYHVADLSDLDYYVVQKRMAILERRKQIKAVGIQEVGKYKRTLYKLA
ncbi:hypothetical protein [Flagellimonas sp. CMM7]|uniref:hypothetical protein n=1 Tax=Flagellimonas sp. CMM7 TaxID=2654676 RepID=UPI0013D3A8FC|nr:hypothetical protein [Flagellimonas sp. CMM7]UII80043.1 hypothetical protein LV704_00630 [Flagellimonas sp. CMM7]